MDKNVKRPSYTWWVITRPFLWVRDTVSIGNDILKGRTALPGRRFYMKFLAGFAAVLMLGAGYVASPYKLIYNYTESEIPGWYLLSEVGSDYALKRGDMIMFDYECPEINGSCAFEGIVTLDSGANVIKRVQGMPGDSVTLQLKDGEYHTSISYSDKVFDAGALMEKTSAGIKLPHLFKPDPVEIIPEGKFYAGNQRVKNAFDSRYFGLVERQRVIGLVEKI